MYSRHEWRGKFVDLSGYNSMSSTSSPEEKTSDEDNIRKNTNRLFPKLDNEIISEIMLKNCSTLTSLTY